MKVTIMLADAADAVGGKLYIMGGAWSISGPGPITMAIAIKVEVPWDRANERLEFVLDLVTDDGAGVTLPLADGTLAPVAIGGHFEVGRPPGLLAGAPLDHAMAFNLANLPLPPGGRYVWRLTIDGETREEWQCAFTTRPA